MATIRDVVQAMNTEQLVSVITELAEEKRRVPFVAIDGVPVQGVRRPIVKAERARKPSVKKASAPTQAKPKAVRVSKTPESIQTHLDNVLAFLAGKSEGRRSEQLQSGLGIEKKVMLRVLQAGLKSGKIQKAGAKRSTVYFATLSQASVTNGAAQHAEA